MRVKFTKDTTCSLGGNDICDFKKGDIADVSEKLGGLLISGKQAESTKAQLTNRETTTDKPSEVS